MVNNGKRSRGCDACKNRHKKCDETFPSCKRCLKIGHRCPGVIRKEEWFFRNETQSAAKRFVTASTIMKPTPIQKCQAISAIPNLAPELHNHGYQIISYGMGSESFDESNTKLTSAITSPSITRFDFCRENTALDHFVYNLDKFVINQFYSPQLLSKIAQILRTSPPTSSLHRIVTAVGLSWLGGNTGLLSLQRKARVEYGAALHRIKDDILDHVKLKSDETLISVILLTMYETSNATPVRSCESFQRHCKGVLALVRERGYAQFNDLSSLRMFRGVRNYMILHCARTMTLLETLENDQFWTSDMVKSREPIDTLCVSVLDNKLPSLRAESNALRELSRTENTEVHARQFLVAALQLDKTLQQWYLNLPENYWQSVIPSPMETARLEALIPTSRSEIAENIWPGEIYVFSQATTAITINRYQVMRLYVQDIISNCVLHLDSACSSSLILTQAHLTTQQIVNDICASVPYQLKIDFKNWPLSTTFDLPRQRLVNPEATDVLCLLFPLSVAANAQGITVLQKYWLEKQMEFIRKWCDHQTMALIW